MILYFELKTLDGHGVPSDGVSFPTYETALQGAIDYWGTTYDDIHFDKTWYSYGFGPDGAVITYAAILAKTHEGGLVSIGAVYRAFCPDPTESTAKIAKI